MAGDLRSCQLFSRSVNAREKRHWLIPCASDFVRVKIYWFLFFLFFFWNLNDKEEEKKKGRQKKRIEEERQDNRSRGAEECSTINNKHSFLNVLKEWNNTVHGERESKARTIQIRHEESVVVAFRGCLSEIILGNDLKPRDDWCDWKFARVNMRWIFASQGTEKNSGERGKRREKRRPHWNIVDEIRPEFSARIM